MSDENSGPSLGVARKKKIAIGVIFLLSSNEEENAKFQDFFFSHFPLFESHMNKLKSAIEQVRHDLWFAVSLRHLLRLSLLRCVCLFEGYDTEPQVSWSQPESFGLQSHGGRPQWV